MKRGSESPPVDIWDVFLCYRQVDGAATAEWLYEALDGAPCPSAEETPARLRVYFDQTAPAVGDWHSIHGPALEKARAMIVICTPGAYSNSGEEDFVYNEISWWTKNRQTAPILIDATGEGERWVPPLLSKKWPDAQRIALMPVEWAKDSGEKQKLQKSRVVSRITQGILLSESDVRDQELADRKKAQIRLRFALAVSILALAFSVYQWQESERSRQRAEYARNAAEQAEEIVMRNADRWEAIGEIMMSYSAFGDVEPDEIQGLLDETLESIRNLVTDTDAEILLREQIAYNFMLFPLALPTAAKLLEDVVSARARSVDTDYLSLHIARRNLIETYRRIGRLTDARLLAEENLSQCIERAIPNRTYCADAAVDLAMVILEDGNSDKCQDARRLIEGASEIERRIVGSISEGTESASSRIRDCGRDL